MRTDNGEWVYGDRFLRGEKWEKPYVAFGTQNAAFCDE
jgi:hypothetical protein